MSDYADQTVAVLAVQGAFAEHEARLSELGAHCIELRQAADLQQDFDRLVLPGGESTVQGKLLDELGMLEELRARIAEGMPVLGTCAGLILLARDLAAHDDKGTPRLATMDVLVEHAELGKQLPLNGGLAAGKYQTVKVLLQISRLPQLNTVCAKPG